MIFLAGAGLGITCTSEDQVQTMSAMMMEGRGLPRRCRESVERVSAVSEMEEGKEARVMWAGAIQAGKGEPQAALCEPESPLALDRRRLDISQGALLETHVQNGSCDSQSVRSQRMFIPECDHSTEQSKLDIVM